MSQPHQGNPTYGPPPAAAYDQPSGPPAPTPPGAAHPALYATPAPGSVAAVAAPARSGSSLGVVALFAAVAAFVIAPIIGAIACYRIGVGAGHRIGTGPSSVTFDLGLLAPVRGWVLVGEIAFWAGTVLGIWALVQGIVALGKNRGRGAAIAAVIIAVLGPIAFGLAALIFVVAGLGAATTGG